MSTARAGASNPHGGFDLKRMGWELDGVPSALLTGFSQRSAQVEHDRAHRIVAFRGQHGREPSPKELREISRRAKYDSRAGKQAPRNLAEHVQRWLSQAREMVSEHVLGTLGAQVFHGRHEGISQANVAELAAATLAVVSDHYSHFNRWNIEAEALRHTAHLRVATGARDELIATIVDAVVHDRDTVMLTAPCLVEEPSELRRASGESVFVEHNSQRFTTHRTLREESALAAWGRRRDGYRISSAAVDRVLAGTKLNDGQRRAVADFAQSGRRVQLLYAPAGAGKTTTMRAFAQAWRAEGGRVYAFGPSARAAQELGTSIKARPHTLHQVTTALEYGVAEWSFDFARGDVLIIDEAAMSGTHTLHDVVRYALNRGADVRLVGDDKQLAAVEAGGAVRWFAHRNGALRLRDVVRFADREQAAASVKLHAGDPSGLDYYFEQGWVHSGSRETMRDAAHRAWRSDLDSGRSSLLIVPANEDVTALNLQARQLRLNRGDVDGGRAVRLHDGTAASKGDVVVTRRNDRLKTLFAGRDFVKNGDTWRVEQVRHGGALVLRHQTSGGTVRLAADYVCAHVELAYAATVNRSQGMSVTGGSSHSLVPHGLTREQLYTQVTRAEHENKLYVETVQHTIDSHQETPLEQTARGVLETVMTRSSAETSAHEELEASLAAAESLRTLVGRHDYVAHIGVDERIETVLTEHAPNLLDLPAVPALRQTLRTAEDLGWQTEHLVPTALAQGSLTDADDAAAVVQWRIEQHLIHEQPPERTTSPTVAEINHWRSIVTQHDSTAAVKEPSWMPVWQRAAAAAAEGLDANAAITSAAQHLAQRPSNDPVESHHYMATVLATALGGQRADGGGWQPALPWMARPDPAALSGDLDDFRQRLETQISARATELRAQVAANPPAWTAALGPRPDNPVGAERWDHLAGLAAAYRDTYGITTDDPLHPLGEEPDGQGLKARAWRDLIERWAPESPGAATETRQDLRTADTALDQLRAEIDPDELLSALADSDTISTSQEEPLSVLTEQHQRATRALLDKAAHQALSQHAPHALDQPAEPALLDTLRRAAHLGWQPERLVAQAASRGTLEDVDDPAAVLNWRIQQHITDRQPPARVAEPTPQQIDRWQALASEAAPNEAVTDDTWRLVWRHAAAGAGEGLDADTAVVTAARHLAQRPSNDPMDAHRYAAQEVVHQLAEQRRHGTGEQPLLPWMTRPHPTALAADPELAHHVEQLATAAESRVNELRTTVARDQPAWTAGIGPRPDDPDGAERWDNLAGLAAAYRETYNIHTTNPAAPLGPEPGGSSGKANAWRMITNQWQPPTTSSEAHREHSDTLDALRNEAIEHREDHEQRHTYDDAHELDDGQDVHSGMRY